MLRHASSVGDAQQIQRGIAKCKPQRFEITYRDAGRKVTRIMRQLKEAGLCVFDGHRIGKLPLHDVVVNRTIHARGATGAALIHQQNIALTPYYLKSGRER
jgi:hypothetical protein